MVEQKTFITFGKLLQDLAAQCRAAEKYLYDGAGAQPDAVHRELANWVAGKERHLAACLDQLREEGEARVIGRRLQYKPWHGSWMPPSDLDQGLQQTIFVNNTVVSALQEESEKSAPVSMEELIADLAVQVSSINRRISLALISSRDL
jgi:hypothetical protein